MPWRRWGGVVCACLAACTSRYEVRTMGDPAADLGGVRTYAWIDDAGTTTPRPDDAWLAGVLRDEADLSLAGRGLERAVADAPDVIIETRALLHRREVGAGDEEYTGIWTEDYRPNLERASGDAPARRVAVAKLLVRVLDPATGDLLWGAHTETELSPRAPVDVRRARVRAAVRRMLEELPR